MYAFHGVFKDRDPVGGLPSYSVRVPFSQSLGGYTGNFVAWSSSTAQLSSRYSPESPMIFSTAGDEIRARYKLPLKSSEATHQVSQPKLARSHGDENVLGMVYASGRDVFYTSSTDNGVTWRPEELVSSGDGYSANPSVEAVSFYGGMESYKESYVVWEENPIGGSTAGYRIWMRKRNDHSSWGDWLSPVLVHENLTARPAAATPVVSGTFVFWKGPSSLLWKSVLRDATYPAFDVDGTDANSTNFAVDMNWNFINEGDAYISWEQSNVGIKYRKGYVDWNGSATWNPIVSIATNTSSELNTSPVVVSDFSRNGCVAWEFKNISTQQGNIKFCKVNTSNTVSSAVTIINCGGSARYPNLPSLSHARFNTTSKDDLTLTWHSSSEGVICALLKNSAWTSPFLLNSGGKSASVSRTIVNGDNSRVAFAMGTSTSAPYQLQVLSIPSNAIVPTVPALISPTDGATTSSFSTVLTWDCTLGASSYRIQVATDPDFEFIESDLTRTSPSLTLSDFNPSTPYYWRVRATNSAGSGAWSPQRSYTPEEIAIGISLSWSTVTVNDIRHPSLSWTASGQSSNIFNVLRYRCLYGQGDCLGQPTVIYSGTASAYLDGTVEVASKTETPTVRYYYQVTATTASNKVTVNSVEHWKNLIEDDQQPTPPQFSLHANYPNPFNPRTMIGYQLPVSGWVSLKVYNILGEEIASLVDGMQEAGSREVEWNASGVASGVYYYRMQAGKFSDTKKLLLAR